MGSDANRSSNDATRHGEEPEPVHQTEAQERAIGPHRLRFEPPDFIHIVWNGDVSVDDSNALLETMKELGQPHYLVLQDIAKAAAPSVNLRRSLPAKELYALTLATAYVGGSYAAQIIVTMVAKATRILTHIPILVTFVATEDEGRAWLAAQRRLANDATTDERKQ